MKRDEVIYCKIKFKKSTPSFEIGEMVEGNIFIKPWVDLSFRRLSLKVILQARGLRRVEDEVIHSLKLSDPNNWLTGQSYSYPFSFQASGQASFTGKKLHLRQFVKPFVILTEDSKKTISAGSLKSLKLKEWWNPNDILGKEALFEVKPKNCLRIEAQNLNPKTTYYGYLLPFLLVGLMISGFKHMPLSIVLGIAFLFYIYKYVNWYLGIGQLGKLKIQVESKTEKQFSVKIQAQKNWNKIRAIGCQYTVYEDVVDQRGSDAYSYKEAIYSGNLNQTKSVFKETTINLTFPKHHVPASFTMKDSKVYWMLQVFFTFKNGSYSFFEKNITGLEQENIRKSQHHKIRTSQNHSINIYSYCKASTGLASAARIV